MNKFKGHFWHGTVAVPGIQHGTKICVQFRRRASAVPEWNIMAQRW